ncbi:cobalt-precorrin 5A hydrolase/precorrin-3B C17-methyltransferase [Silvimonas terrae]|uniref:Cobalt-precorrin 5A hydrolase/precorrin-3B C17-methyltransferase n=1 Tax=Silvimonas terrae TaxID=300266 RepID=A0A840REF1_9NEIS|nr:precorrin-3B C(17)-methyltransferase [Silvimonas terrae]MBB5190964.1 cobalt-precorrin 5A hydrolase/precorrin-3B C17-methyltransferase [Silvimonas terrae]
MAGLNTAAAIVILGTGALETARRIQAALPGAQVHALAERVEGDIAYADLSGHLKTLYAQNTPIIALCAAGIVIRCVAPLLVNKGTEPPVLAVAEDGSAVVPLLGGLTGANVLARQVAAALAVSPAITTSGELRFGTCLLNPPAGYTLADLDHGKRFVSDLLAGAATRVEGDMPWLGEARLPQASTAEHVIRLSPYAWQGDPQELVIHPQAVIAVVAAGANLAQRVRGALAHQHLAPAALAAVVMLETDANQDHASAAAELGVPLRLVTRMEAALPGQPLPEEHGVVLLVNDQPVDPQQIGHARGNLTVLGLGPGRADLLAPAARKALDEATDVLGYDTYVNMAGPFRGDQTVHGTDNREELQRARHAFELALTGRRVVMVSSGDPGVFAMAAAVLEALDNADDPRWGGVALQIIPGISAALATAAVAGAPLGHDFCMLSLSDNLKPWDIIEKRLALAAQADLVMAFYNPISRARPWQLDKALEIVRQHRAPDTVVVLGRDIGRPGGKLTTLTLGELQAAQVDMRTMVLIGSSTTRRFTPPNGPEWVYTPRFYP